MNVKADILSPVFQRLPDAVQPGVESVYNALTGTRSAEEIRAEFIAEYFASGEYEEYAAEFRDGPTADIRKRALADYREMTGPGGFGDVGIEVSELLYGVIRKESPDVIVETGVCNGVSTLSILLALRENGHGTLHSIDYPYRADEDLSEFRSETFDDYGGAAIPADTDPGWIIPDELRTRWNLYLGKSQRELPKLLTTLDDLDVFIHDSEHSLPCMLFEFELAYEWLDTGGVLLADDITWNDAFDRFVASRDVSAQYLDLNVGFARKR